MSFLIFLLMGHFKDHASSDTFINSSITHTIALNSRVKKVSGISWQCESDCSCHCLPENCVLDYRVKFFLPQPCSLFGYTAGIIKKRIQEKLCRETARFSLSNY